MTNSPTTENGPLHTPEATLDDRLIRATYATADGAQAARQRLIEGGLAAERISIVSDAAGSDTVQAALEPKDEGVLARIREAILPDDSNTATLKAARNNEAILEVRPTKDEVESAVWIIEASGPSHFDADLERWRSAG